MTAETTILFYRTTGDCVGFSNFSPHPVNLKGKNWPTTEHYFQAKETPAASSETQ